LEEAEEEATEAKKSKLDDDPNAYDPFLEEAAEAKNANGDNNGGVELDELQDEIAQSDVMYEEPAEHQFEEFGTNETEEAQQFQEYAQQNEEQLIGEDDEQPAEDQEQEEQVEEEVVALPARGRCSRRGRRGRAM